MRAAHLGAQRPHRAGTDHAEAARPCQRVKVKVPLGVGQGHSEGGGGERVKFRLTEGYSQPTCRCQYETLNGGFPG